MRVNYQNDCVGYIVNSKEIEIENAVSICKSLFYLYFSQVNYKIEFNHRHQFSSFLYDSNKTSYVQSLHVWPLRLFDTYTEQKINILR